MTTADFNYHLPEKLIAQQPVEPRDSARLLMYNRKDNSITDKHFYDLADILQKGDILVVNNTKVLPARIYGKKATGANIEFLLHKRINDTDWESLCSPAKRVKKGDIFTFSEKLTGEIIEVGENGERKIRFTFKGVFEEILVEIGEMPLPHYIKEKLTNPDRYQTVYASVGGSAAAPTAGLHFTPELMDKLRAKGVEFVEVLLHVGLGTFLPVKVDNVKDHKMHSEYFEMPEDAAAKINKAKKEGRRVIAVGTTAVRVLESASDENGILTPSSGETDIFIYPPYKYKAVDALITNFHLPESTLIMLVAALLGREETLKIYKHAVDSEYRFFSFGDACLFL